MHLLNDPFFKLKDVRQHAFNMVSETKLNKIKNIQKLTTSYLLIITKKN